MTRNEPSALQIILDELRLARTDMRIEVSAIRADLAAIHQRANDAHKRIDKYENRMVGWIAGAAVGSGGLGAMFAKWLF